MCQLLGMNCNVPTDIVFSFTGFHHRGGRTDHHSDGWGIAFYEGKGCRLFLDTVPAAESPLRRAGFKPQEMARPITALLKNSLVTAAYRMSRHA